MHTTCITCAFTHLIGNDNHLSLTKYVRDAKCAREFKIKTLYLPAVILVLPENDVDSTENSGGCKQNETLILIFSVLIVSPLATYL
jgi:hypothetical protein